MAGIHYIVDSKGKQTAVVIDLKRWGALWRDFQDAMLVHERRSEPREPLAAVKRRLVRSGKLAR